jgi:hypothetical protein
MMMHEKSPTLDDVLNEFVAEHERPTAEAVAQWARRYPQYRHELIDFAAAWAEQLLRPPAPELDADVEKVLIDRAMSHVLNVEFSRNEHTQVHKRNEPPIDSLIGEGKKVGFSSTQEFAEACGLDVVLMSKLNNRQIRPRSVPSRLISHMARLLHRAAEAIAEYLARPPKGLAGKAFLSRGKPQNTEQQSFADAVRASSLSDAEKACWLDESASLEEN